MNNYEQQYKQETGIDLYTMDGPHEILDINLYFEYATWLEEKLTTAESELKMAISEMVEFARDAGKAKAELGQLKQQLTSETARADKAAAEAEEYRGQTLTLIFALEDCIETIEYVSNYVSGQGLSAEDDCQASVKNALDVISRIKGE